MPLADGTRKNKQAAAKAVARAVAPRPRKPSAPPRKAPNQAGPAPTRKAITTYVRQQKAKQPAIRRIAPTREGLERVTRKTNRIRRARQPFARGIAPTATDIEAARTRLAAPAVRLVGPKFAGMQENLRQVRKARQPILTRDQFDELYLGTRSYDKYLKYVSARREAPVSMIVAVASPLNENRLRRMVERAEAANLRGRLLLDNEMVFPFGSDWVDVMSGRRTVVEGRTLEAWPTSPWQGGVAAHEAKPPYNWQSDNALDIMAPIGTPIYAVADGVISASAGFGRSEEGVRLQLDIAGNSVFYQHNSAAAPGIRPGVRVRRGQLILYSGAGSNGAQHLHIATLNGDPEDMFDYGSAGGVTG